MYNHAPKEYLCPICLAIKGIENKDTLIRQSDISYRDDLVTAFVSSFFIGKNLGHVLVVPNRHFENIYDLPIAFATRIQVVAREVAIALKEAYRCEGITTLQNNEPVGNQHAFHYHLHIFPRYTDDNLHANMLDKKSTTPEERLPYADKVKKSLAKIKARS